MKRYTYAGGERIAMRSGTTLYYLFGDHLGSTSVVANSTGSLHSRQLYKAWGENRWNTGTVPTTFRYTGQRQEAGLGGESGLYDYGARFYDPYLNRWTQPDAIVPDLNNPLDHDRYSYVRNNPLKYVDPSGHNPLLIAIAIFGAFLFFSQIPSDQVQTDPASHGDPTVMAIGATLMVAPVVLPAACLNDGDCTNEAQAVGGKLSNSNLKNLTGKGAEYENWIVKNIGGEGSFKLGGTQYDNKLGNVLMEAKSYSWANFTPSGAEYAKFQNQIGRGYNIAIQNGYQYLLRLLNRPPDYVIEWLEKHGIKYIIETEL